MPAAVHVLPPSAVTATVTALRVVGLAVIAADDHAVIAGRGTRSRRCRRTRRPAAIGVSLTLPVPAPVRRVEDPGRLGPARAEPDVVLAARDEAGAAGGEGPLVGQGLRAGSSSGSGFQFFPPSSVAISWNRPLTGSLRAMPLFSSQKAMASKKAAGSAFLNWSAHDLPPSVVL